ncbi:hypothetical protein K474DRAFT_1655303 [Panus rudis PR-1116 ss-1]|nr:hypothetical protein K474DRAFT_1655303 [Panus rudis PR-1116 ss-1]
MSLAAITFIDSSCQDRIAPPSSSAPSRHLNVSSTSRSSTTSSETPGFARSTASKGPPPPPRRVVASSSKKDLAITSRREGKPPAKASAPTVTLETSTHTKHDSAPRLQAANSIYQHDTMNILAQAYAWQYMTATTEDCYEKTRKSSLETLEASSRELSEQEDKIADARIRFEAERVLDFCDQLSDCKMQHLLPSFVQEFLRLEGWQKKLATDALYLSQSGGPSVETLQRHHALLLELDTLEEDIDSLEGNRRSLLQAHKVDSRLRQLLGALCPLFEAWKVTQVEARTLVEISRDSCRTEVRLASPPVVLT